MREPSSPPIGSQYASGAFSRCFRQRDVRRSSSNGAENNAEPPRLRNCFARRGSPDPAVRLTGGFHVTRRRSGTGRPAVAEDSGSGDHCPNRLVRDQLFTGTGRACGKEKEEACTRRAGTDDEASPQAVAAFRVQASSFSSPQSNPRRHSGAWRAVRGRVARSLESLSPLRSSGLRWDESGTVRRAYDAFAPRWNPTMPVLRFPGSHSSQSWKLPSAARPRFGSPCQWPGHRHVARNEHLIVSLVNLLARFAIGTVRHPGSVRLRKPRGRAGNEDGAQWSRKSNRQPDVLGGLGDHARG